MWQVRINATARKLGMSYSKFMGALKKNNININRKVLADMALKSPAAIAKLVDKVK